MSDVDDLLEATASEAAADAERIDVDALIARSGVTLGGFDPRAIGARLGMNDRTIQFALGLVGGMDATAAMRAAGHPGKPNALRSAASKAARSKRVMKFLEIAKEHKAGIPDGPLGDAEKLGLLAKLSRSNNPAIQTRAILAHQQLQNEMSRRAFAESDGDPVTTLKEIAAISPLCAIVADELARTLGIEFRSADALALPAAEVAKHAAVRSGLEGRSNGAESANARG